MRAVLLDAPADFLEERRRRGHDRWDEVWEGILHMVPPPSDWHQRFGTQLLLILTPLAETRGIEASYETGVYGHPAGALDYRVPDLVFARAQQRSARGIEGEAEVVVEILSPGDESREKLPFYAALGIREVWLIDPETRAFELYVLRGGAYRAVVEDASGATRSPGLGVTLKLVDGPRLRVSWEGGARDI
jgi:Uma2 family endonuclease